MEETETFIVHYQSTVAEPTIEQTAEIPAVEEEGEDSNDQGGVVGPNEATPSPSNSLRSCRVMRCYASQKTKKNSTS